MICDSGNLTYVIGIGDSKLRIYRQHIRQPEHEKPRVERYLFEYFNSEEHNLVLHDVSVTLIDKSNCKNPIKRENFWPYTLKTLAPLSLNVQNDF